MGKKLKKTKTLKSKTVKLEGVGAIEIRLQYNPKDWCCPYYVGCYYFNEEADIWDLVEMNAPFPFNNTLTQTDFSSKKDAKKEFKRLSGFSKMELKALYEQWRSRYEYNAEAIERLYGDGSSLYYY